MYNPDSQKLFFDDLPNCRDLGGIVTVDGKTIRRLRFVRSASPSLSSLTSHKLLKDWGVRTVIDLRSEAELISFGNPFREDRDVNFYNIPLFSGDPNDKKDTSMEYFYTHTLGDYYCLISESFKDKIATIFRIFINNTDGACMFHCAFGKDRTGVIACLLYLLAGVEKEIIIHNYEISMTYEKKLLDNEIKNEQDNLKHTLRSDRSNIITFLDYLDTTFGKDTRNYYRHIGLTEEEIDSLYRRLF